MSMNYANLALQAALGGGAQSGAGVWSGTGNASYGGMRWQGYPDFLTDDQKMRLERVAQARVLFEGLHREFFLDSYPRRTQWNFPPDNINGSIQVMYLTFNLLGLTSLKFADLLFGQIPAFDAKSPDQYAAIQKLSTRSMLHAVLAGAAVSQGPEGEAFLEAVIAPFDRNVYVRQVPSDEIFPVGEVREDGQYDSYARYRVKNVGTSKEPQWLLLEVTSAPGVITRKVWQLDKNGAKVGEPVSLDRWDPSLAGQEVTRTGLEMNTIVWVPALLGKAHSDYNCALIQQDKFNSDNTRVGRILAKHSNPKIGFPRRMSDAQGNIPAAADAFFLDDMTQLPKYVTWDANLEGAIQDRAFTLNQLLVRLEMSPVLLGLKEGAAPDAYKKVRLEAFNSITAASRKAVIWTAGVQRILDVAMALDNTRPGISYPFGENAPVGVTLRDGIPTDEGEQATNISTLRTAGAMSRYRAVLLQLGDVQATEAEVKQIEEETAAAAPSVNIELPAGDPGNTENGTSNPPEGGTPNENPNDTKGENYGQQQQ
jgi:hypothetical protein